MQESASAFPMLTRRDFWRVGAVSVTGAALAPLRSLAGFDPATQWETWDRPTARSSCAPVSWATRTNARATWACDHPVWAMIAASGTLPLRASAIRPLIRARSFTAFTAVAAPTAYSHTAISRHATNGRPAATGSRSHAAFRSHSTTIFNDWSDRKDAVATW
jgi:hypothetical protein